MPRCSNCGEEWTDGELLEKEGLQHFFSPDAERTIIEPGGPKWVVVFHKSPGVRRVKKCRKCPMTLGAVAADA